MKAKTPAEAKKFEQIPNIGKAIAKDFQTLGFRSPADLRGQDPYQLYVKLCEKTKTYHDPCLLDTFISAVFFMEGKGAKPWWDFTEGRKKQFHKVSEKVLKFR